MYRMVEGDREGEKERTTRSHEALTNTQAMRLTSFH